MINRRRAKPHEIPKDMVRRGSFVVMLNDHPITWIYKWFGRVLRRVGPIAVVEFLGFGEEGTRTFEIDARLLTPIDDIEIRTRLYQVLRRMKLEPVPLKGARNRDEGDDGEEPEYVPSDAGEQAEPLSLVG